MWICFVSVKQLEKSIVAQLNNYVYTENVAVLRLLTVIDLISFEVYRNQCRTRTVNNLYNILYFSRCLKTQTISTIGWWAILTLNSERVFCLNSGTNWPSSIILYPNCRIEFTFETACFPKFLPKWGFAKND